MAAPGPQLGGRPRFPSGEERSLPRCAFSSASLGSAATRGGRLVSGVAGGDPRQLQPPVVAPGRAGGLGLLGGVWGRAQRSPLGTAGLGLATAGAVGPAGARRAPVVVQGEGAWSFSKLASVGYLPLPLTDLRTVPGGTGVWGRVCGLEQTRRTAWGGST